MYVIHNNVTTNWGSFIDSEMQLPYFQKLQNQLNQVNATIYPSLENVFNAFNFFDIENTHVVILGQDPYINEHQAHGLAFSVANQVAPKSLINIFKELRNDLGITRTNCNLSDWAEQGVLLLNTILTVNAKQSLSHQNYGWETFTTHVIQKIDQSCQNVVFVLWGKPAQKYAQLIQNPSHLIIQAPHPSPLSAYRGFFHSHPFSQINSFLMNKKNYNIKW